MITIKDYSAEVNMNLVPSSIAEDEDVTVRVPADLANKLHILGATIHVRETNLKGVLRQEFYVKTTLIALADACLEE